MPEDGKLFARQAVAVAVQWKLHLNPMDRMREMQDTTAIVKYAIACSTPNSLWYALTLVETAVSCVTGCQSSMPAEVRYNNYKTSFWLTSEFFSVSPLSKSYSPLLKNR